MQGILKSNHQRLCDCLREIKESQPAPDHKLDELENELQSVFITYQEKMGEIRELVQAYEQKQKTIKYRLKKMRKYSLVVSKKIGSSLALGKAVVLSILLFCFLIKRGNLPLYSVQVKKNQAQSYFSGCIAGQCNHCNA
jgi:hypothetical protein